MSAGDLTTLAAARAWIGSQTNNDDALLASLITAASQLIVDYVSRPILSATYTEKRHGNGQDSIVTKNYPITAVTSVTVDTFPIPPAPDVISNGYDFDDVEIVLRGYCFNRSRLNVVLVYTAGYSVVPPVIAQVCNEIVGAKYRERDRIGQVSKRIEGEVVTFSQKDLSDSQKLMLRQYVNVTPVGP